LFYLKEALAKELAKEEGFFLWSAEPQLGRNGRNAELGLGAPIRNLLMIKGNLV
jgi:hypothetical protein